MKSDLERTAQYAKAQHITEREDEKYCIDDFIAGANSKAVQDEMCRFAEWFKLSDWQYYDTSVNGNVYKKRGEDEYKTTDQLLTLFKQQG